MLWQLQRILMYPTMILRQIVSIMTTEKEYQIQTLSLNNTNGSELINK
jgi:hypothetical protein